MGCSSMRAEDGYLSRDGGICLGNFNRKYKTPFGKHNCYCSVVVLAIEVALRQSSFGSRHEQFLFLDSFLCRCAAYGCHHFAPAHGVPSPLGAPLPHLPPPPICIPPRNAPPPIPHGPPHAHPPLCPCVPLELPAPWNALPLCRAAWCAW